MSILKKLQLNKAILTSCHKCTSTVKNLST